MKLDWLSRTGMVVREEAMVVGMEVEVTETRAPAELEVCGDDMTAG